jgi:hypothetical protein
MKTTSEGFVFGFVGALPAILIVGTLLGDSNPQGVIDSLITIVILLGFMLGVSTTINWVACIIVRAQFSPLWLVRQTLLASIVSAFYYVDVTADWHIVAQVIFLFGGVATLNLVIRFITLLVKLPIEIRKKLISA